MAVDSALDIGERGNASGEFDEPRGLFVDSKGNVFVADTRNDRVQKFDESGVFVEIVDFKTEELSDPSDVFVDSEDNLYVADTRNNRVLKVDADGDVTSLIDNGRGTSNGQLDEPRGLFVDSKGNVFVADTRNDRVQKFDESGVFVEIVDFKTEELSDPSDVFVDSEDNLYVADTRNNRVLKVDADGDVTSLIDNGRGTSNGQLDEPRGLFVDSKGNVFVADTRNDRVQKFDESGVFVSELGEFGIEEGQFMDPQGLFVDSEGNVFVADTKNNRIQGLTAEGNILFNVGNRGIESGQFDEPRGLFVDSKGNVFVADTRNDRVQKFDESVVFVEIVDFKTEELSDPSDVFVDSEDNLYVADTRNNRVLKVDADGDVTSLIDNGRGTSNGQLDEPRGLFVDSKGNVFVADTRNDRVQKFDESGVFVEIVDFKTEELSDPSDVFVDSEDNLYVADTRNNRVLKVDADGDVTSLIDNGRGTSNGQLDEPRGVMVNLSGNVFVADTRNDRVQKFDESGVFVSELGEFGIEEGQFMDPQGLFVDSEGNVFVADTKNNRIQKFDSGNTDDKITIFIVDPDLEPTNPFSTVSFGVINPFNSPVQNDIIVTGSLADLEKIIADIVAEFNVQEYKIIDAEDKLPNTTWSVPATIIELDTLDNGMMSVVFLNELISEQELHVSINNDSGLDNGGIIKALQFTPNETINSLRIGASFSEQPKVGSIEAKDAIMYLIFDVQGVTQDGEINLNSTSQFEEPPTISFRLGPIEGTSNHPTHPKSTENAFIQCPNIKVGLLSENSGEVNTKGISVFRNINGDTTESCGYTAVLDHFSTYAIIPRNTGGSSSSGGEPPSIRSQVYGNEEFPLEINGIQFRDITYTNQIETQVIKTGEKFNITLLITEELGSSGIEFVGLFMNLYDHNRQIHLSDTHITYSLEEKLQIFDPNELFSDINVTSKEIDGKLKMSFDITFDKEMPTSDIIIRMWDTSKNSEDTILSEILTVTESNKKKQDTRQDKKPTNQPIPSTDEFRDTVKNWRTVNSDYEILKFLDIDNSGLQQKVPEWFKSNISQWILDELLNQEDLKEALEWMDGKKII